MENQINLFIIYLLNRWFVHISGRGRGIEEEKADAHPFNLRHGRRSKNTDTLLLHPRRDDPSPTSSGPLSLNHGIRVSRVIGE